MNIHPLWFVCLLVRLLMIYLINRFKRYKKIILGILVIFGLGFFYQGIFSSNKEKQVAKVFWHDVRFLHSFFMLSAAYYFYNDNLQMTSVMLLTNIAFSIIYRIWNKV